MNKKLTVDCISEVNSTNNDLNSFIYKNLEDALEDSISGDKIFINPGRYSGADIESNKDIFDINIEGSGTSSELNFLILGGKLELRLKTVKLNEVTVNCNNSYICFKNVDFYGNNKFTIENGENSEIEFIDCVFGVNYQLYLKNGKYSLTFKNCKFRDTRTIPIIFSRNGKFLISLIMCVIKDIAFVHNKRADINIRQSNCMIEFLSNSDVEDFLQQSNSICNYDSQNKNSYNYGNVKTNVTCFINTDIYSEVGLDRRTIFVRIYGSNSVNIFLPSSKNVKIGSMIEIVNECPFFIIEEKQFSGPYCKVIFTTEGWFFYKY